MTYISTDQATALAYLIQSTILSYPCIYHVVWSLLPVALIPEDGGNKVSWLSRIIFLALLTVCGIEDSINFVSHSNLREDVTPLEGKEQEEILIGRRYQPSDKRNEPIYLCSVSNYDVDVEAINTLIGQLICFEVIGYLNPVINQSCVFDTKN